MNMLERVFLLPNIVCSSVGKDKGGCSFVCQGSYTLYKLRIVLSRRKQKEKQKEMLLLLLLLELLLLELLAMFALVILVMTDKKRSSFLF